MPFLTQSDWEDRKRRFPIHYFFGEICLNTFLAVSRIEFAVLFFCVFLCFIWGCLIRGSRAGESQLKTASCPARACSRVLGGRHSSAYCAQARLCQLSPSKTFVWRAGSPHPFIVAVVALDLGESRQSEHVSTASPVFQKGHR